MLKPLGRDTSQPADDAAVDASGVALASSWLAVLAGRAVGVALTSPGGPSSSLGANNMDRDSSREGNSKLEREFCKSIKSNGFV